MLTADTISKTYKKAAIPAVRPGDTVRVHQTIREGAKQRVQVFEGVVIRTDRLNEVSASVTVRRIASGVGVEKSFLLHSPNVNKIDIVRRAKVRRKYLSYLRERRGKSARLTEQGFDRVAVNAIGNLPPEKLEAVADDTIEEPEVLGAEEMEDAEPEVVESTEELARGENKAAAKDDAKNDGDAADDEAQLDLEETQEGLDRADESA